MTEPRRPKLRLVGAEKPPAAEKSPFDDLEKLREQTREALEAEDAERPKRERRQRSAKEFSRVPWHWLEIPAQHNGFPAWVRFHLCLWYRTHEGKKWVRLTTELAAEAGIYDRSNKRRELGRLEAYGLVEVRRDGGKVPMVRALPYPRGQK